MGGRAGAVIGTSRFDLAPLTFSEAKVPRLKLGIGPDGPYLWAGDDAQDRHRPLGILEGRDALKDLHRALGRLLRGDPTW